MFPLELQLGSWASSGVAAETRGSSLVAGSSRFPRELPQGTEISSRCAARNQSSSGFAAQDAGFHWIHGTEVRVLLKFGWYSGFLVTLVGCPVEFSCGDSSLAGMCKLAPFLLQ